MLPSTDSGRDRHRRPQSPQPLDRLEDVSTGRPRLLSARRGLRLAGLILVLVGLFGMHGLGGHETVAMGSLPEAGMAEMPVSAAESGAAVTAGFGHQMTRGGSQGQPETDAVGASGPGGMGMGMTAMCLAILTAAFVALVSFLLGGRVRSVLWVLWVLARQAQAVLQHRGRDPDRPSLTALSIQRC